MPHGQDALDFVPNPAPAMPGMGITDLEKAKGSSDHIEEIYEHRPDQIVYTGGEDDSKPRTGLRKLMRRNPSFEFIKEVAEENRKELDPVEVGKVEKKLFWMIVPALAVDYAFYYVRYMNSSGLACADGQIDKTTLSYAAIFGIKDDLDLHGTRYSNLSSIFYIGWLVWAIPGNLLLSQVFIFLGEPH